MKDTPPKSVVVIGAGPLGLEAALRAASDGHSVRIFESGSVGEHLRAWSHVRLFSPWSMNCSERARSLLTSNRSHLPFYLDECPTGEEFIEQLLVPLSRLEPVRTALNENTRVLAVGRERTLKAEHIGSGRRSEQPFRILVTKDSGVESIEHADVVIDASGTLGQPNWLGSGGIAAPGESTARKTGRIESGLPDLTDPTTTNALSGKRVLLVGLGHSAATTALGLRTLLDRFETTTVTWSYRHERKIPFSPNPEDPLPERRRVEVRANEIIEENHPRFSVLTGLHVDSVRPQENALLVTLKDAKGRPTEQIVDKIYANVGFQPDDSIHRQLQVHQCYATFGPIKLAAALLGETSKDCLDQTSHGVETLMNPEPNFFIVGMKSYGTAPNFLIRIGLRQIDDIFDAICKKEAEAWI